MKISYWIPILLCFLSSCEIDDDFGEADLSENRGTLLASTEPYTAPMIWYSPSQVLVHQLGLSILNVETKSVTNVTTNFIYKVAGVTLSEKAIVAVVNPDNYTYSLVAITLPTNEWTVLSDNVYFDYFIQSFATIAGDEVAYAEVSGEIGQRTVYVHNVQTNERNMIMQDGFPLAFSPDKGKLLYLDLFNSARTYDLQGGTHSPVGLIEGIPLKIVWTEQGIIAYAFFNDNIGGHLEVRNLLNEGSVLVIPDIPEYQSIFISADGSRFSYPTPKCANPYYVYDCYGEPALVSLRVADFPFSGESEVARFLSPNEFVSVALYSGAFSPDRSKLVFIKDDAIYLVTLP